MSVAPPSRGEQRLELLYLHRALEQRQGTVADRIDVGLEDRARGKAALTAPEALEEAVPDSRLVGRALLKRDRLSELSGDAIEHVELDERNTVASGELTESRRRQRPCSCKRQGARVGCAEAVRVYLESPPSEDRADDRALVNLPRPAVQSVKPAPAVRLRRGVVGVLAALRLLVADRPPTADDRAQLIASRQPHSVADYGLLEFENQRDGTGSLTGSCGGAGCGVAGGAVFGTGAITGREGPGRLRRRDTTGESPPWDHF